MSRGRDAGRRDSPGAQAPVQYFYDELNRLIAVVDVNGDTATYNYDAVGNILSISRYASTQVSVVTFVPKTGPVGTTVTISGTGFSTTPAQNSVTFNGTGATVSSATATTLVVTVPSGASTGQIGVTSPGGSATSAASFTVAAAPSAPTITSVSPSIVGTGDGLTVSGTGYEASPTLDRLALNVGFIPVSAATSTSLSATTQGAATSGKVSVTTPNGTATSLSDLFVAPTGYTASQVNTTGRMTVGSSQAMTVSAASSIGLMVFDATAGQRVSATFTAGSISAGTAALYDTGGKVVRSTSLDGFGRFLETFPIPSSATYTIRIAPTSATPGSTTLALYSVSDLTGTFTLGTGASLAFTTPGQLAKYTFAGTSGHRYSIVTAPGSPSPGQLQTTLLGADGLTVLALISGGITTFIEPVTVSASGTYRVLVDPDKAGTGNATTTVYDVPADLTGTISPGGSAVTAALTTPGMNGLYTVGTPTNTRVSLKVGNGPIGTVTIKQADGTTVTSGSITVVASFIEPWTFASGQTMRVDPTGANAGSVTLTAYDVPADTTGSTTVNATAVAVPLGAAGQNGTITFPGTASQQITVRVTGNTIPGVTVKLLSTNGTTVLASSTSILSSFNLSQVTLPATGTYTISVDPTSFNTGSLNVSATNP